MCNSPATNEIRSAVLSVPSKGGNIKLLQRPLKYSYVHPLEIGHKNHCTDKSGNSEKTNQRNEAEANSEGKDKAERPQRAAAQRANGSHQ